MTRHEQELACLRRDLERADAANATLAGLAHVAAKGRRDLASLARATRTAQERFFRSKSAADLAEMVRLQAALDAAVAEILDDDEPRQGDLFGGRPPAGPYGGEGR